MRVCIDGDTLIVNSTSPEMLLNANGTTLKKNCNDWLLKLYIDPVNGAKHEKITIVPDEKAPYEADGNDDLSEFDGKPGGGDNHDYIESDEISESETFES